MTSARPRRWKTIATAAVAAFAVAIVGALMTDLSPWYFELEQPSWKPPDALFGPAWTVIFALCAVAGVKAWERRPERGYREWLLVLFAFNAFLNVFWSLLFFRLQRPDWALFEVSFLWASVAVLIWWLSRASWKIALLLLPYLIWVTVAGVLNSAVVELNAPFN
ncbi:MAG: tryptophan-rich sensory protein [Gammaproteobacteria bacterium]|nr:tryptophan-rich sensory protein [Gammaproteobacteria bacterium]TVQ46934.1 MAG: tryptophan-rich sensory protein [Gammaproteobacteria bacterium]